MRRVKEAVPIEECKRRALRYMATLHRLELMKASQVANQIWPEAKFKQQGAGAAASRVLRKMIDGTVTWDSDDHDWGYRITSQGRRAAEMPAPPEARP